MMLSIYIFFSDTGERESSWWNVPPMHGYLWNGVIFRLIAIDPCLMGSNTLPWLR